MKTNKTFRRLMALVLTLTMCLSLVNITALAVDDGENETDALPENALLVCELEEHTHTEECYEHDLTAAPICGLEESEGHEHTDECYGEPVETLVCGLEETEGHTHTDECNPTTVLTCELPESEGHTHIDNAMGEPGCYTWTPVYAQTEGGGIEGPGIEEDGMVVDHYEKTLTCGLAETQPHTHDDSCYTTETTLVCGLEETEGHTHTGECYAMVAPVICGLEESAGHTHTEACYPPSDELICEIPEHTHGEECYEYAQNASLGGLPANGTVSAGSYELNGTLKLTGTLVIKEDVTISGSGTIDASGIAGTRAGSAIEVKSGHLTLSGITIQNGSGTQIKNTNMEPRDTGWFMVGGGIYVEGGVLTLNDGVTITNNTAQRGGGIFVNNGATLVMNGGTVSYNQTVNTGTKKNAGEGGGIFVYGTALITGGEIVHNTCNSTTDLGGGGLYVNNSGTATLVNATVTNNTADGFGGGIAGCCHGESSLVATDGVALYGNKVLNGGKSHTLVDGAKGAGGVAEKIDGYNAAVTAGVTAANSMDFYTAGSSIISNYMAGGGSARYTMRAQGKTRQIEDTEVLKFEQTIVSLTANPTDNSKKSVPSGVLISDNHSTVHGGGIGCNGGLYFGEEGTTEIDFYVLQLNFNATKTLHGRTMGDKEFTFGLYYKDKLIAEAKNDVHGNVSFAINDYSSILNDSDDSWKTSHKLSFTMKEISDNKNNTAFDQSVYRIDVELNDKTETKIEELKHTTTNNYGFKNVTVKYTKHTLTEKSKAIYKIVDENGKTLDPAVPFAGINFINNQQYDLTLSLVKYVEVDGVPTTVPLKGATFELWKKGNPDTKVGDAKQTGTDGKVTFTANDVLYTDINYYYFKETAAPEGFVPYEGEISTGAIVTNAPAGTAHNSEENATVYNTGGDEDKGSFSLNIVKYDPEKGTIVTDEKYANALNGAKFSLTYENQPIKTYETKNGGKLTIDKLAPGSYKLVETEAPTGFVLPKDNFIEFNVGTDGKVTVTKDSFTPEHETLAIDNLEIPNKQAHGRLTLSKKVVSDGGALNEINRSFTFRVTGKDVYGDDVNFKALDLDNPEVAVAEDGKSVLVTVQNKGKVTLPGLPYGTYNIQESGTDIDGNRIGADNDIKYFQYHGASYKKDGVDGKGIDILIGNPNGGEVTVAATNEYKVNEVEFSLRKDIKTDGNSLTDKNIKYFENQEFKFVLKALSVPEGGYPEKYEITVKADGESSKVVKVPVGTYMLYEDPDSTTNNNFDWTNLVIGGGLVQRVDNKNHGVPGAIGSEDPALYFIIELYDQNDGNSVAFQATNHYTVKKGTVSVHKDITLDGAKNPGEEGEDIREEFTFTISGTTLSGDHYEDTIKVHYGDKAEFENVPYGNYTITEVMEQADVDYYNFGSVTFKKGDETEKVTQEELENHTADATRFEFTLDDDTVDEEMTIQLDVTNEYTRKTAEMSVSKIISGNNMDYSSKYDFTVAFKSPVSYLELADSYEYSVVDSNGNAVLNENGTPKTGTIQLLKDTKTFTTQVGDTNSSYTMDYDSTVDVDGVTYTVYGTIEGLGNGEKAVIEGLPVGVKWHVVEVKENQGYYTSYESQNGIISETAENAVTVTNSSSIFTAVNVQKVWVGDDANRRPASITVQLVRDGIPGESVVLDAANGWSHSWSGLTYGSTYDVVEVGSYPGYTASSTGSGRGTTVNITITNTYDQSQDDTVFSVNKVWQGDDEFERPSSVTVQLYENDAAVGGTVTLSAENGWSYTWTGLTSGASHRVEEINVPEGYSVSYNGSGNSYTIYNTYTGTTPDDDIPDDDIPDDDVPLDEFPEFDFPDEDVPLTDLPEDDVPLAEIPDDDVPKTGDESKLVLWLALLMGSGLGLTALAMTGKKKEEEE